MNNFSSSVNINDHKGQRTRRCAIVVDVILHGTQCLVIKIQLISLSYHIGWKQDTTHEKIHDRKANYKYPKIVPFIMRYRYVHTTYKNVSQYSKDHKYSKAHRNRKYSVRIARRQTRCTLLHSLQNVVYIRPYTTENHLVHQRFYVEQQVCDMSASVIQLSMTCLIQLIIELLP